jgi:hypothetical protein
MKVDTSKIDNPTFEVKDKEILPFVPAASKLTKENSMAFKLRLDPSSANSTVYEKQVRIIHGAETARELIEWHDDVAAVITGMNADGSVAQSITLVKSLIKNSARTAWDAAHAIVLARLKQQARDTARTGGGDDAAIRAAADAITELQTRDQITECIRGVLTHILPTKCVARVKRYLRRNCRKPADMTIRQWFNHYCRMNWQEIPKLPPTFNTTEALSMDESIDILLFSTPKSWQAEMERHNFDPYSKQLSEVIDFCENLENAERIDGKPNPKGKANGNDSKKSSTNKKKRRNEDADYYCSYHGSNSTHNTDKCKVLKNMISEAKGKDSSKSKNKSWSRKASDAKDKSKKELNALVREMVKEEMACFSKDEQKKRSSDNDDSSVESVDSKISNHEANAVDEIDFSKLDFDNMDDIKEKDEDMTEVSV